MEHLRHFMEHHIYAVWDFMSLIKALQDVLAPVRVPWTPPANPDHANFINRLVLEEESDAALGREPKGAFASHFESYYQAMVEAGVDTQAITSFLRSVERNGLEAALKLVTVPACAARFMGSTFRLIHDRQPHQILAVVACGREDLVPGLFASLRQCVALPAFDAASFRAYLERHIQLDGDDHAPRALAVLDDLCAGSARKRRQACDAVEQSLLARLDFWDGIHGSLRAAHTQRVASA